MLCDLYNMLSGIWRHLNKTIVLSAWIISLLVASFVLGYSEGINADPGADAFIDQKGLCGLTFPDEWWKVMIFPITSYWYVSGQKLEVDTMEIQKFKTKPYQ